MARSQANSRTGGILSSAQALDLEASQGQGGGVLSLTLLRCIEMAQWVTALPPRLIIIHVVEEGTGPSKSSYHHADPVGGAPQTSK